MSGYIDSGYWDLGYSIGDVVLPSSVNSNDYIAYVNEEFVCVPMQAFSDLSLTYYMMQSLPSGLTLDQNTGIISGISMLIANRSQFVIYGIDSSGAQAECIFYIEIKKDEMLVDAIDPVAIALSRIALQYRSR